MSRNRHILLWAVAAGCVLAAVIIVRRPGFNVRGGNPSTVTSSALTPLAATNGTKINPAASNVVTAGLQNKQPNTTPPLSTAVLTAIGNGEPSFQDRLKAVAQFGRELSSNECAALYGYIRSTTNEMWLRPGQSFAIKNEILNSLLEQKVPPADLTDFLISLKHDAVQPLVLQDYALQQMAPWHQKASNPDKQRIIAELESAAQETDKSYAGTALLALQRIEQENPGIHVASMTNSVMELITKESANLLARITAMQLSGQMELPEAREPIRRIAGDSSAPETLRISAVASLRSATDQDTREFLKGLADGSDHRLKQAAISALKNDSVQNRN